MGAKLKPKYSAHDYFNYLYFFLFGKNNKFYNVCIYLHELDFNWEILMDENREYDGYEIRKYYLSDEHGYLPEDIDIYDIFIFPKNVSVLEMLVGFLNRLCRDVFDDYTTRSLIKIIFKNLDIQNTDSFEEVKQKWDCGMRKFNIFPRKVGSMGLWDKNNSDLWSQAMEWYNI